ncbi:glycosyltransferase family 2 protein [Azospirillum rugosum]|uniref:GT2 family glycosyltransferase n=1 Tax=Azospirillum rugosum TaxID=416170 RepID=A0ABS4SQ84_9PROT|nr:glycosyltransferase family 2 protein [Azospirillum rugosum]MBP2294263.1 GT2 family glycosyltransferase [Azospirillum rugosum]MDQ0527598.1 GT2 family glycosyltransferase [Azospirillum rugosum]
MTNAFPTSSPPTDTTTGDLGRRSAAEPFYGRLEGRDGTRLFGWALSVAAPDTPVPLVLSAGPASVTIVPDRDSGVLSHLLGRPVRCGFDIDLALFFPGIDPSRTAIAVRVAATGHLLENGSSIPEAPRTVVANVDGVEGPRVVGWAVNTQDEQEAVDIDVLVDDAVVAGVSANRQRRDLLARFSTCDHGFEVLLSVRSGRVLHLRDRRSGEIVFGPLAITLDQQDGGRNDPLAGRLEELAGILEDIRAEMPRRRAAAARSVADYAAYFDEHYADTATRRLRLSARAAGLDRRPLFSVVMPVCDPPLWMLAEAIESVRAQAYGHWELCIADDASRDDAVRLLIRQEAARDPRIRAVFSGTRGGVSANTNRALSLASGDHVAFLDHDDRLAPDALLVMAEELARAPVPVLYSDEDRIAPDGRHVAPAFKPGFDPELLSSLNYVCHLLVAERRLLLEIGGLREGYEGVQDHDLVLRLLERVGAAGIRHVPRILYHWRINPASLSGNGDPAALLAGLERVVAEHHGRIGSRAAVTADRETHARSGGLFSARIRYPLPAPAPKVSIVVPTKDAVDLVRDCVSSLLAKTDYPDYEIVLVDHDSADPRSRPFFDSLARDPRVRVVDFHGPFNWAAINNAAVGACRGDALCFLNNDVVAIAPGWLAEMVSLLARPGVGAVGAKLLYPNGTVQHAGIVLGAEGIAGHAFVGLGADEPGHLGQAVLPRTVSAVTGACLLTSRAAFDAVGGFDMVNLPVAYADVDYCLKLQHAGLRVLWTPHARLYHLETQTRGTDDTPEKMERLAGEAHRLRARWGDQLRDDSFYNPHFEPCGPTYRLLRPPSE